MSNFIWTTNDRGEQDIWGYELYELGIALSDDAYGSLWTLLPEYAGDDPLGTPQKWATLREDVRQQREQLFAYGLIDCKGNVTDKGKRAIKLVNDTYDEDVRQAWDEVEMAELDDLDRQCRKRPKFSRYDG